jgi:hypothetical protein
MYIPDYWKNKYNFFQVRQISHDINIHALKLSQFVLNPKISVELQDRIIYMRHLFFPFHLKNIDDSKM